VKKGIYFFLLPWLTAGFILTAGFYFATFKFYFLAAALAVLFFQQALLLAGMFFSGFDIFFSCLRGHDLAKDGNYFLRFDDGPHPVFTIKILDLLKRYGIRAVFCVNGNLADRYPDIIKRIFNEHHLLVNHTYSHPYRLVFLSRRALKNEIEKTSAVLQRITGKIPRFFAPPMGHRTPKMKEITGQLGMQVLMWDINSRDTREKNTDKILKNVLKKARQRSLLLFHDGILPFTRADRNNTITAVEKIINHYREQQWI